MCVGVTSLAPELLIYCVRLSRPEPAAAAPGYRSVRPSSAARRPPTASVRRPPSANLRPPPSARHPPPAALRPPPAARARRPPSADDASGPGLRVARVRRTLLRHPVTRIRRTGWPTTPVCVRPLDTWDRVKGRGLGFPPEPAPRLRAGNGVGIRSGNGFFCAHFPLTSDVP